MSFQTILVEPTHEPNALEPKPRIADDTDENSDFQNIREIREIRGSWLQLTSHFGGVLVLMIQRVGFPNGDNSPVRRAFQEVAVAALVE